MFTLMFNVRWFFGILKLCFYECCLFGLKLINRIQFYLVISVFIESRKTIFVCSEAGNKNEYCKFTTRIGLFKRTETEKKDRDIPLFARRALNSPPPIFFSK